MLLLLGEEPDDAQGNLTPHFAAEARKSITCRSKTTSKAEARSNKKQHAKHKAASKQSKANTKSFLLISSHVSSVDHEVARSRIRSRSLQLPISAEEKKKTCCKRVSERSVHKHEKNVRRAAKHTKQ